MILNNLKYLNKYIEDKHINKFINYIKVTDLTNFEKGVYEIEGKDFFLNIVEYNLKNAEEGFWEAHRDYLDIHFMIIGEERIKLNFIHNLKFKEYKKEYDFVSFEYSKENSYVDLSKGDFLVCYPEDAHMTGIKIENNDYVKKAIFKIKL